VTLLVAPLLDRLDERQTAVKPFSLLFALILMNFVDIPVGLLSVGAIDFGIIVDGAVIMADSIVYRLSSMCSDRPRGNYLPCRFGSSRRGYVLDAVDRWQGVEGGRPHHAQRHARHHLPECREQDRRHGEPASGGLHEAGGSVPQDRRADQRRYTGGCADGTQVRL